MRSAILTVMAAPLPTGRSSTAQPTRCSCRREARPNMGDGARGAAKIGECAQLIAALTAWLSDAFPRSGERPPRRR